MKVLLTEVGCTSIVLTKDNTSSIFKTSKTSRQSKIRKRSGPELFIPRAGLTLIELVVVLVIVAIILIGFGNSANTQVKRANRSDVENELNVIASNMSDAYYDLGNNAYDPTKPEQVELFKNLLKILQTEYLGVTFDIDHMETTDTGFHVFITEPLDAWEQPYECWFTTAPNISRYVMIASGGDDLVVDSSGYASQNYNDDVVLVVYPKDGG